jgi:hypothetical protein
MHSDRDTIDQLLQRYSIVTVAGPAGSGKSYEAQSLATEVFSRFQGGGRILDLHAVDSVSDLLAALATALGFPPPPLGREAALAYVETALKMRVPTLIVLDGLHRLLPRGRATLSLLMHAAPHLRWLLTARHPLGLRAEAVHFVGCDTAVVARGPSLLRLSA